MRISRHSNTMLFAGIAIMALTSGCAKPIQSELYSRSPTETASWKPNKPAEQLLIGVGVDSPSLAMTVRPAAKGLAPSAIPLSNNELLGAINADRKMPALAQAFINQASQMRCFEYVGYVTPENLSRLDYQVELTVTYEHEGNNQVQYCLGRVIANIYNSDHSQLQHRVVRFHEAMYTPGKRNLAFAHDGTDIHSAVQQALFSDLIRVFTIAGD